ncbi:unnamed protein product [Gordionus sp. m RMFG-2023]
MELPKATTPKNIQNGFLACGIYPFNPDIFSEDSYLISNDDDMSELSNIPLAVGKLAYCDPENDTINSTLSPMTTTSDNELCLTSCHQPNNNLNSQSILPHPILYSNNIIKKDKRRKKSEILTSSPYKKHKLTNI